MPYKHWLSPFSIQPSLKSTLDTSGLVQKSWQQIDVLPATEVLILFNPPDLVFTQADQWRNPQPSREHHISHIANLYRAILKQAESRSIALMAAWQLQLASQTIALRELFSLNPDHYSTLRQDAIDWPAIEPIAAVGVQQLDQQLNGELSNLYVEIDQLAIKFGRLTDSRYSERLRRDLNEKTIIDAIHSYRAMSEREALMLKAMHKTQEDYRNYILEAKAIIKNYQELLNESQLMTGYYRNEVAKLNQELTSS